MRGTKSIARPLGPVGRGCASIGLLFAAVLSMGCASCSGKATAVDFEPAAGGDWEISTPEAEGLERGLVEKLYENASNVETIRALLVVKNGKLIAERYFNGGSVDRRDTIQSATKSITSALVGIAVEEGFIPDLDQKMLDFFPEIAAGISDPRKKRITIELLLQMRAGYPWEESHEDLWAGLLSGDYVPLVEAFPLVDDPGTAFHYSNLSSNWLGIIVDRQSGMRMKSFAEKYLFSPLGIEPGDWGEDWDGHNNGCGDLRLRARDMAKFGQLYINGGRWNGEQIVPEDYVEASLRSYTEDAWRYRIGRNVRHTGYGYQWWSAQAGRGRYDFAWGHGGQQIALVREHGMVVVVAADPLYLQHGSEPWRYEKENLNLVGDFVATLPGF